MKNRLAKAVACAVAFAVAAWASPSQAQAGDFCATAPADLLVALDGGWSLRQGPGVANAAGMSIPLPPHPPVAVRFDYNAEQSVVHIVSADLADGIDMFPTAEQQSASAAAVLADQSAPASPCDWYALPTLIGTNAYFFVQGPHFTNEPMAAAMSICIIYGYFCDIEIPPTYDPGGSAAMEMTLVLRFASADSGSGIVVFSGEQDGYSFRASAPVQLSRN